jgi:hypothetical protein
MLLATFETGFLEYIAQLVLIIDMFQHNRSYQNVLYILFLNKIMEQTVQSLKKRYISS